MASGNLKRRLKELYNRCNRREMVEPDPLQFLYGYPELRDREIAGLIAAGLAYGRVKQILASVKDALERIPSPAKTLRKETDAGLRRRFAGFRHRFTSGDEVAELLIGIRRAQERHGSLLNCFQSGLRESDENVLAALASFVRELRGAEAANCGGLLASPEDGSASKRMNLFLRWMVRRDNVDPGGWEQVGAHRLVVPLDTHIGRIGRRLGLTRRKQNDLRTALEITAGLRQCAPDDPVKYDFALSRLGIRKDMDEEAFLAGTDAIGSRAASGKAIEREGRSW